jgi:hypothetical protein
MSGEISIQGEHSAFKCSSDDGCGFTSHTLSLGTADAGMSTISNGGFAKNPFQPFAYGGHSACMHAIIPAALSEQDAQSNTYRSRDSVLLADVVLPVGLDDGPRARPSPLPISTETVWLTQRQAWCPLLGFLDVLAVSVQNARYGTPLLLHVTDKTKRGGTKVV